MECSVDDEPEEVEGFEVTDASKHAVHVFIDYSNISIGSRTFMSGSSNC